MKDIIVNLVGASGSGKTTIAKELEKKGGNIIHSFTNRDPRHDNEWGHTFASVQDLEQHSDEGRVVAFKEVYEGCYYWATKEQYQEKGVSIYVVCPDGAKQTKERVKDADVATIYIQADWTTRLERMNKDGRSKESIVNRLNKDEEVFKVCECDYVINANRELEVVLADIEDIIVNKTLSK